MAFSQLIRDRRDELSRESMRLTPGDRLLRALELSELGRELNRAGSQAWKDAKGNERND